MTSWTDKDQVDTAEAYSKLAPCGELAAGVPIFRKGPSFHLSAAVYQKPEEGSVAAGSEAMGINHAA